VRDVFGHLSVYPSPLGQPTHSESKHSFHLSMLSHSPLSPHFGLLVHDMDVSLGVANHLHDSLRQLLHEHGLLMFKNQQINEQQQAAFASIFGKFSRQGPIQQTTQEVTYVSNTRHDGTFGKGELQFHSDQYFFPHPMKAIMLYAIDVPLNGGHTLFAHTHHAFLRMPLSLREALLRHEVLHTFDYDSVDYGEQQNQKVKKMTVSQQHPAVTHHPWSQKEILTISQATGKKLIGPSSSTEKVQLMAQANAFIADPEHIYSHAWEVGDLIIWDNLLLQHARPDFDPNEKRTLRRCALAHDMEAVH
jgi:alpha-ketoglutarate-dependent taurine dioxygenase